MQKEVGAYSKTSKYNLPGLFQGTSPFSVLSLLIPHMPSLSGQPWLSITPIKLNNVGEGFIPYQIIF